MFYCLQLCSLQQLSETLHRSLARRGPDYSSQYEVLSGKVKLFFMACVLHMRGELMTHQPAVSQTGDVLLWNGEIFGGLKVMYCCWSLQTFILILFVEFQLFFSESGTPGMLFSSGSSFSFFW